MTYLVAYDIRDNRTRSCLARYLLSQGIRLQKSVYIVEVERHVLKRFKNKIEKMTGDSGQVAIFRVCAGCRQNAIQFGEKFSLFYGF